MLIQPLCDGRNRTQRPYPDFAHRVTFPKVVSASTSKSPVTPMVAYSDSEIDATARAAAGAVDSMARECIATRTGIPMGYIIVFVAKETR